MSNSISLKTMISYINSNVVDLSISERRDILQMIVSDSTPDNKIHTKGDGTLIRYQDITDSTIINIYNFTQQKIKYKTEQLKKISLHASE